ncbi:MAG: hexose kinase [Pirellulales bacterium]|nr:hexose kinase [Pirellulales bacterium]
MIVAAGLSPAWQQILVFEQWQRGAVNRAQAATWCASGKVINVAWALAQVRAAAKTVCTLGGDTGRAIADEFAAAGIDAEWIWTHGRTRVCTTLLEAGGEPTTELVENAAAVSADELERFLDVYRAAALEAPMAVLSGSLPQGTPYTFYDDLLGNTPGESVLDFRGAELMACLHRRPRLVKPNRHELEQTLGHPLADDADAVGAARQLNERGAQWVLLSHGAQPALLCSATAAYRLAPPSIQAVNPIGSGDSLAAIAAWSLTRGAEMPEAVRLGMAAATENALELLPARFDPARLEARAREINVARLD